ncbi:PAS domain S-box protein [Cloacibacterium sp.]|uniref:PAS domain S-box protein n=1 Tax=Cloacibacterium sp. TaxID=1913682 RepID=UPI0039E2A939
MEDTFHKLLNRQINKYLSEDCKKNSQFQNFIQAIDNSYKAFERDKELMNHAFYESEQEYNQINKKLKEEYELKEQSIENLYKSLQVLEEDFEDSSIHEKEDDLLFVSNYLNKQLEKTKKAEKELTTTLKLLKTLLANLQTGILFEDEDRKILFTNQLFCDMFRVPISPDEMIGIDCSSSAEQSKHLFVEPEKFASRINELLEKKEIINNELLETIDGRFLERNYIPIFINETYKGQLWKYNDVTQRIKTQSLLVQSEERNRLIMNSALNAIIIINSEGDITFWNNQAEIIFGWKKDEVLNKSLSEIIIPDRHIEGHKKGMTNFLKTGEGSVLNKQIELPAMHKNGHEFPVEISIIPIQQNNELIFCSFIQDISERKKAENYIKRQEEKYRNIIANMNLGLIEVDNNEVIQFANQSFCDVSGFELEELVGKNPAKLFLYGVDNVEFLKEQIALRKKGISSVYQLPIKNKRGEIRWWAISGAPNYDDQGNLLGSIGIHLDISDQKKLEEDLKLEKAKALEASKAKEVFLANMSHEIRTPLNAIIGFLRELKRISLNSTQTQFVENSYNASQHLLSIINNILDISKIESGEMTLENKNFSLKESINNVITILQPKAQQKKLKLFATFKEDLYPTLKGDSLKTEQILYNIIGNSLKFTDQGEIKVECKVLENLPNLQKISISIIDTGIGMSEEYVNNIFKKFTQEDSSVSRKYGGTGLGMVITKELVSLMKGSIDVKSEKNVGTKITITLSIPKGNEIFQEKTLQDNQPISIDGVNVLLVEDNELNQLVAENSLNHYNCIVTKADNGRIALDILKKNEFDIILMDIQMPELDGIETTKILRKEFNLKTPIIALTANAFKTEIDNCIAAGMIDYITKPFIEENLVNMIHKHTKDRKTTKTDKKEKLYNLENIRTLSRGDEQFIKKMLTIFINQVEETIPIVEEAFAENNYAEIARLIHKIKPSIEGVGIFSIREEVKLLEISAKEQNTEIGELYLLFQNIKNTLFEAIIQLKEELI